jgi:ATP-dependent exoDNAse (exonuclease V) alpha subunit
MALYHFSAKVLSRSGRNTVRAIAYRSGCKLYDEKTGESFNYEHKAVEHVELLLPKDAPAWAVEIQKLMAEDRKQGVQAFVDKVEAAEKRVDSQVWREFEFALHRELTKEQNMALAREFVADEICSHGMAAQLNFHFDEDKETGEAKPHCHVTATMRYLEEDGLSAKKERAWNSKAFLCDLRIKWEEYSNTHLKLHGHDVQIDHRSHRERGIEMEPQPKLGRNILEQEKRIQKLEGREALSSPVTDKGKAFHDAQLRNLYRIIKNPETVLDIITKHHATFMWADVQKRITPLCGRCPSL